MLCTVVLTLGHVWTSPNSALGLAIGLAGMPFGARPYLAEGAVAFRNFPRATGALVLGGVILHSDTRLDAMVPTYAARCGRAPATECVRLGAHEHAHLLQYLALGPLFLPLYAVCGGVSARNRFERAADRYALTGHGWWPWQRPACRYH